jgi:hypothetical protein
MLTRVSIVISVDRAERFAFGSFPHPARSIVSGWFRLSEVAFSGCFSQTVSSHFGAAARTGGSTLSLDPILSESSFPMPGIEFQPVVAIRCRIFLPSAPPGDLVHLSGSGCPRLVDTGG